MTLSVKQHVAASQASSRPRVEWEETPCPLCTSERWSVVLEAPDHLPQGSGLWFAVVQCRDCGLCYTNPRPSAASMGQFYPADYGPHQPRPRKTRGLLRWLLGGSTRGHNRNRQPVPGRVRGRLLDFGCGSGSFLFDMHRNGWEVLGIDPSPTAVQHIRTELGLSALTGSLPHPDLRDAHFNLITMWQSLEHVHHPLEVLQEARRLLVPGGKVVVAVPNIDSLGFRWFGTCWHGLDLPRHLIHFAPWTLQLMLERAGFRVKQVRMMRRSGWMRWSARLLARYPQASHWRNLLQIPLASRLVAGYSRLTKQSDSVVVTAER